MAVGSRVEQDRAAPAAQAVPDVRLERVTKRFDDVMAKID